MDPFAGKPLAALVPDDLNRLVGAAVPENLHLDYKRELLLDDRDQKKEFLRDVSAFANAEGGVIVYGIDEERDATGKGTGLPNAVTGFDVPNRDQLVLTIEHLVKDGIDERLPRCDVCPVPLPGGKFVVVIRVPPSLRSPHMVTLGGERRFFVRASGGKQEMSTAQIRDAAARTESVFQRLAAFTAERLAKWRSIRFDGPIWIMQVVPLVRSPDAIDVTDQRVVERLRGLAFWLGGFDHHHCVEGFKVYEYSPGHRMHAIAFRDGTIEFLAQHPFVRDAAGVAHLAPGVFDQVVFQAFGGAMDLYRELAISFPVAACVTLSGVRGYTIGDAGRPVIRRVPLISENQITTDPLVLVEAPADEKAALRPAMDFIWNAFGYPRCGGYGDDGKYRGYR